MRSGQCAGIGANADFAWLVNLVWLRRDQPRLWRRLSRAEKLSTRLDLGLAKM